MPLTLDLHPRRLVRGLAAGVLVLHAANLAAHAAHFRWGAEVDRWVRLLDVDAEANVPTWYSSVLLALCAVISRLAAAGDGARRRSWIGLFVLFTLLSADEVATVHETVAAALLDRAAAGQLAAGWVWAVGALLLLPLGAVYLPFVVSLPASLRWRVVSAGAIFVTGGLGLEAAGHAYARSHGFDNWGYRAFSAVEELFEMMGAVLYLRAVAEDLWGGRKVRVQVG